MRFRAATVALQALQCAMRSRLSHEVAFARIMKGHSQKWSSLPPEEQEACERRAETLRQDRRQQRSEASEEIQQQLEALVRRADQEQQQEGIRIPSRPPPPLPPFDKPGLPARAPWVAVQGGDNVLRLLLGAAQPLPCINSCKIAMAKTACRLEAEARDVGKPPLADNTAEHPRRLGARAKADRGRRVAPPSHATLARPRAHSPSPAASSRQGPPGAQPSTPSPPARPPNTTAAARRRCQPTANGRVSDAFGKRNLLTAEGFRDKMLSLSALMAVAAVRGR